MSTTEKSQSPADGQPERSSLSGEAGSREERISEAAFFKAAARGFVPGHEWDDWLAAEKEIDAESSGAMRDRGDGSGSALRPDPNSRLWSS